MHEHAYYKRVNRFRIRNDRECQYYIDQRRVIKTCRNILSTITQLGSYWQMLEKSVTSFLTASMFSVNHSSITSHSYSTVPQKSETISTACWACDENSRVTDREMCPQRIMIQLKNACAQLQVKVNPFLEWSVFCVCMCGWPSKLMCVRRILYCMWRLIHLFGLGAKTTVYWHHIGEVNQIDMQIYSPPKAWDTAACNSVVASD